MLIIIRGNSGSGKSTTAHALREKAIENGANKFIALVEQDYFRRIVLKEKESVGADNIDLIDQTVKFLLDRDYVVILEGILSSKRYGTMIQKLCEHAGEYKAYYMNVSLAETLNRHNKKPNAHEFGEAEMTSWYKPLDLLGIDNEFVLEETLSQEQIIDRIRKDTGL